MTADSLQARSIAGWRAAGIRLLVVACLVGFAFTDTWLDMAHLWLNTETFSHGIAVAPISAWLLWRDRSKWLETQPEVSAWGGILIIAGAAIWFVAELALVKIVAEYGLLTLTLGLVWSSVGTMAFSRMAFPLAFLYFMVPAGESLNAPLMEATATATIAALRAVGLPVFREGMLFTLPTGSWSVVEACSGLRYVLAAAMLGALFAWMNFRSWRRRLVFFIVAILLAVVANWARAWLVVMIGHLSQMRYGVGEDHVWYGWVFFGLVMAGLFWMGARWRESPAELVRSSASSFTAETDRGLWNRPAVILTFGLLVMLVAALPWLQRQLTQVEPRPGFEARTLNALRSSAQFEVTEGYLVAPPKISGARALVQGSLALPQLVGVDVEFTSAYFAAQSEGHEMIASANHPAPDRRETRWTVVRVTQLKSADSGLPHAVREYLLANGPERRLMWSWYSVGGWNAASEVGGKVITAWSLLRGQGDHSCMQVISVSMDVPEARITYQRALELAREALTQTGRRLPCS